MMIWHMTRSLMKSCVVSLASQALLQQSVSLATWNSNLEKTCNSTSTSGRNFIGGVQKSFQNMEPTRWHCHLSALPCKTLSVENCVRSYGMSETSKRFSHCNSASMRLSTHTRSTGSTSTEGIWRLWRTQLKSTRPPTRNPTTVATRTTTQTTIRVDLVLVQ